MNGEVPTVFAAPNLTAVKMCGSACRPSRAIVLAMTQSVLSITIELLSQLWRLKASELVVVDVLFEPHFYSPHSVTVRDTPCSYFKGHHLQLF